jgi:hypothetical protein
MRFTYWGIYYERRIEELVNLLFLDLIQSSDIDYSNSLLKTNKNVDLAIRKLFDNRYSNKPNIIDRRILLGAKQYIEKMLIMEQLYRRIPIIGFIKTRKFIKNMKLTIGGKEELVLDFCKTGNTQKLVEYNEIFGKISFRVENDKAYNEKEYEIFLDEFNKNVTTP